MTSQLQREIRIGNYLLGKIEDELDERKAYWEEYQIKDSDDFAGIRDYWDKPIPITEEWLVKLGFKNKSFKTNFHLEIDDSHLEINILNKDHCWLNGRFLKNINHVHQLQNIFHSLTGYELTIKEKENDS